MIGIYKITNPNGRVYIGQSIDVCKRWKDYRSLNSKTKGQPLLWRSLQKHKPENHKFKLIEICNIEQLNIRERYWQEYYDVLNGGLNCVYQKTNYQKRKVSQETRDKMSKSFKGRKPSAEVIEKLRVRMMGNTYNVGRKRPQCEKDRISEKMKLISRGENNNMYGKLGEDSPNSKIILNTLTGIYYFGCMEASIYNNFTLSKVKKALCGNRRNNTPLIYV